MANKMQIKRSTATALPTDLASGELAYTSNGEILFLGHPDGTTGSIAIGGRRVPGTLTANQALVANSSSAINEVRAGQVNAITTSAVGANVVANTSAYFVGNSTVNTFITQNLLDLGGQINANASVGTAGQVLTSGAAGNVYWSTVAGTTYDLLAVANTEANKGILQLDPSSGANDDVFFIGANGVVVSSNSSAILITGTAGDITGVTAGAGLTGGGSSGDVTLDVGAGNGISVGTDAISVNAGSTLTVNTAGVHVNNALSITDLILSGNLTINGTLTTIDTTNLVVKDSLIKLANGNVATDTLDIGFFGVYDTSGTQDRFAGIFRDATDGTFKVFANTTLEPTTIVDPAGTGYVQGTLQSYLTTGALVANSSAVNITANSTVSVALTANSLSLSTALPATSGGTGTGTYAVGDLLVGGAGNTLTKLTVGTDGKVLQSNGTSVVYADLDGGTF